MKRRNVSSVLLLVGLGAFGACGPILSQPVQTVGGIGDELEATIARISQNPDRWLDELRALEAKTTSDTQGVLDRVNDIMQRGIAMSGETVRCTEDFTARRVNEELRNLLHSIKSEPLEATPPFVCTASPDRIDLGGIPQAISYSGYGLNTPNLRAVVVDDSGQETDISVHLSGASPYSVVLNLSGNRAGLRCDQKRIALRWGGAMVADQANNESSVPLVWPVCQPAPPAPSRAAPQPVFSRRGETCNGGLTGCRDDRSYGGPCSPGFEYLDCQVTKNAGAGHCEAVRGGAGQDCSCVVHFGAPAANGVDCNIKIIEQGTQPATPPAPPCACRNGVSPQ
jgi:hypothetical protein